jgi:cytochrome c-type biogenesis protein CcmH
MAWGAVASGSRSRRDFVAALAGALGLVPAAPRRQTPQDSLPGSGPAGRLWDPERAGRPLEPVTAADNDAAIQAIEKQIHCTCGCNQDVYTCRTTDFTCTTSPAMHRRVVALAQEGRTGPEILAAFVREHGVAILMAPPRRGVHLTAYLVPPAVLVIAAGLLILLLVRWTRSAARHPGFDPGAAPPASPEELERLRRALDRLPG